MPEQRNKRILDEVRKKTYRPLAEILPELDRDLVRGALAGAKFKEVFAGCRDAALKKAVESILS